MAALCKGKKNIIWNFQKVNFSFICFLHYSGTWELRLAVGKQCIRILNTFLQKEFIHSVLYMFSVFSCYWDRLKIFSNNHEYGLVQFYICAIILYYWVDRNFFSLLLLICCWLSKVKSLIYGVHLAVILVEHI